MANGIVTKKYTDRNVCTYELLDDYIDILSKYNITISEVKEKIREKLQNDQTVIDEVESIKIDETRVLNLFSLKSLSKFALVPEQRYQHFYQ